MFALNYMYDLPNPGKRLGSKLLGAFTDSWTVSGVASFSSGAPFMPGLSTTYTVDTTGSGEGARITVVGAASLAQEREDVLPQLQYGGLRGDARCAASAMPASTSCAARHQ